jgi:hypothetical protein
MDSMRNPGIPYGFLKESVRNSPASIPVSLCEFPVGILTFLMESTWIPGIIWVLE